MADHNVLIVGCDTYIGYNLKSYLDRSNIKTRGLEVQGDINGEAVKATVQNKVFTAIVLVPVLNNLQKIRVFSSCLELSTARRVILVSRDGVTMDTRPGDSPNFANLLKLERQLLYLKHPELAVVVRYGWLAEYFFWTVPYKWLDKSPLPIPTITTVRPVAAMDVIASLARLATETLSSITPSVHHQNVYTVTGPRDGARWSYKNEFYHTFLLRSCERTLDRPSPTGVLPNSMSVASNLYERFLRITSNTFNFKDTPAPPLWPSQHDLEILSEFFQYANGEHHPAERATDHFERICQKTSSLQSTLEEINSIAMKAFYQF